MPLATEWEGLPDGTFRGQGTDVGMKAKKPQEACDVGLFSDSPRQLDLVELANTARKS